MLSPMSPPLLQCAGQPGGELHLGERPALALPLLGNSWRLLQVLRFALIYGRLCICLMAPINISIFLSISLYLSFPVCLWSLSLSSYISHAVSPSHYFPTFLSLNIFTFCCLSVSMSLSLSLCIFFFFK